MKREIRQHQERRGTRAWTGTALHPSDGRLEIQPWKHPKLSSPAPQTIEPEDLERFIEIALEFDDAALDRFVASLIRRGIPGEHILTDLIPPAAREMGARWERDDCNFLEVTIVLGRLQRLVRAALLESGQGESTGPESPHAPSILLGVLPHQQHTLGLVIASNFFRSRGWVVSMTPSHPGERPSSRVARSRFDVVAFSLATPSCLSEVEKEIRLVRNGSKNSRIRIIVGGGLLERAPEAADGLGADAIVIDPQRAPEIAEAFLFKGV